MSGEDSQGAGASLPVPPPEKLSVGVVEAAQMLSCSTGSIRKFIRQRRLPRLEGFRVILIPISALEKFVADSSKVQ